jgi:hypothetical protein
LSEALTFENARFAALGDDMIFDGRLARASVAASY